MKTKKWFLMIVLITVIQFSGCSLTQQTTSADKLAKVVSVTPTPEITPKSIADENFEKEWKGKYDVVVTELERNLSLWKESKIINYDFVVHKSAGGVNGWTPALIKVREGVITSVESTSKPDYLKIDGYEDFNTINKMFEYLRQELEKGRIIKVEYNEKFGYPKRIDIMYSYGMDTSIYLDVKKFEVIK
jgi:hypothetical protein